MQKIDIKDIRQFTDKTKPESWLPSIKGYGDDFNNTFNINGTDENGQPSKTAIYSRTDFNQSGIDETSLKRFFLILYCLQNDPYSFDGVSQVLDYSKDGFYLTPEFRKFLADFQTLSNDKEQSKSLVYDHIKFYRPEQFKSQNGDGKTLEDISSIRDYTLSDKNYNNNVVGILGKVTYDSIVKHTLYSLLVKNNIVSDNYEKTAGVIWSDEAAELETGKFDFFIDVGGGPYSRSFPVICVYTKDSDTLDESAIKDKAYTFLKSKFFRSIGKDQLVEPINEDNETDKNFIKLPCRNAGDATYCVLFDFAKVILLSALADDKILDLLKISLSFFSRKRLGFINVTEFKTFYVSLKKYLQNSFNDKIEQYNFKVLLKNKHSQECTYNTQKDLNTIKSKLDNSFKAEASLLFDSLEKSYAKIVDDFERETKGENKNNQFSTYPEDLECPIILHFDTFYNLLAVTSKNTSPTIQNSTPDENLPFKLEDYSIQGSSSTLIEKFFENSETLPKIKTSTDTIDYQFIKSIAIEQDIALITDVFLKQIYENLEDKMEALKYDTDSNQYLDSVIKKQSINLLKLIKDRTDLPNDTEDTYKKEDFIYQSNNKLVLKNEVVKKIELKDLILTFTGTKEEKIKFQTISHFLFLNRNELQKRSLTVDDFSSRIYYPLLSFDTGTTKETPRKPPRKKTNKEKTPNNNFAVNNIITSQLKCYKDISTAFNKALNAKDPKEKVYYAFQGLVFIGLPILLALYAQSIANKIAELKKKGNNLDPSLLECLLLDADKLKKSLLGYADLASNKNNLQSFLFQFVPRLPTLPQIPAFLTFDSEKELKRRLLAAIIDLLIKSLRGKIKISLKAIVDMCNSDSYLIAFLNAALPTNNKNAAGTSTPSGLPNGTSPTIYIPAIKADINILIDESKIETRENVYGYFRQKYSVDLSNSSISDFFSAISDIIDAGEMASLLRGSSSESTRSIVLSKIVNYKDQPIDEEIKYYMFIGDEQSVGDLFLFLSDYIDYTLCYGLLNDNLNNYAGTVCEDINSKYDDNILSFGEVAVTDQIADLTKSLDEICRSKNPLVFDVLTGGPSFLTKTLRDTITKSYNIYVDQIVVTNSNIGNSNMGKIDQVSENTKYSKYYDNSFKQFQKDIQKYQLSYYFLFNGILFKRRDVVDDIKSYSYLINVLNKNLKNEKIVSTVGANSLKDKCLNDLNSAGNVGLKTELVSFDGYIRKYRQLKNVNVFEINKPKNAAYLQDEEVIKFNLI